MNNSIVILNFIFGLLALISLMVVFGLLFQIYALVAKLNIYYKFKIDEIKNNKQFNST